MEMEQTGQGEKRGNSGPTVANLIEIRFRAEAEGKYTGRT